MKAQLLNIDGKKQKEISLPKVFSARIREDILKKTFESEKTMQPYGPNPKSGKQHSAAGIIRHLRHVWKGGYGFGRSRIPRKIMWRRGTQFYWIGAEVNSTRGGRRAHPPKIVHMMMKKKINKKEKSIALASGIAGTSNGKMIKMRYERLSDKDVKDVPFVVDSKITGLKTQELIKSMKAVLGDLYVVAESEKSVRAGRGKLRNRKYKKTPGVLIVVGNDEEIKTNVFDVKKVKEISVEDLYPLGRLVVYTENALKDLEGLK
ncbi:50S ribosomal protein L4 [Candidatus Pacearchaeota archaeon]|nr:50S ribosomal protein L4 [Candidatus Pacearchaeota archaeon]|tara:strand:+ start:6748 stop:7533 length:786 start_codon:yes stop_codon:yes gene_type:complete